MNTRQRLAFVDLNSTVVPSISSVTLTDVAVALINASSYQKKKVLNVNFVTIYDASPFSNTSFERYAGTGEGFLVLILYKNTLFCANRGFFLNRGRVHCNFRH